MSLSVPLELVIRSSDRRPTETPDAYTAYVPPNLRLGHYNRFYVKSVTLRGSRVNITEGYNYFYFVATSHQYAHYLFDVKVPEGHYTPSELASVMVTLIQLRVETLLPDSGIPVEVTVTYDSVAETYTIHFVNWHGNVSTVHGFHGANEYITLQVMDSWEGWQPGQPDINTSELSAGINISNGQHLFDTSLNKRMGFYNCEYRVGVDGNLVAGGSGTPGLYWADKIQNIDGLPFLFLCSDIVGFSQFASTILPPGDTTGRRRHFPVAIAHVIEPSFGARGVWEPGDNPVVHEVSSSTNPASFQIEWRDENGWHVDFNNVDHVIVLRFYNEHE